MNRFTCLYVLIASASAQEDTAKILAEGCSSKANASAHIEDEVALLQTKLALVQRHTTNSSAENSFCFDCGDGDAAPINRDYCFHVARDNQCSNGINAGNLCHQYAYYINGERKRCYNGVREATACRPHSSIHGDTQECPNRYLRHDAVTHRTYWELTNDDEVNAAPYTRFVVGSSPLNLGVIDTFCGPAGTWTAAMAQVAVDTYNAIWWNSNGAGGWMLPVQMLDQLDTALTVATEDLAKAHTDRGLKTTHGANLAQHFIQEHRDEITHLQNRLQAAVAADNHETLGGMEYLNEQIAAKLPLVNTIRAGEQTIINTPDATYQQWIQEYNDKIPVYTEMHQDLQIADTNDRDNTIWANYRWNQWKEICTMYKLGR